MHQNRIVYTVGLKGVVVDSFFDCLFDSECLYFDTSEQLQFVLKYCQLKPDYVFIYDSVMDENKHHLLSIIYYQYPNTKVVLLTRHSYESEPLFVDFIFYFPLDIEAVYHRLFF